jgi:sodium/potassium-transporting ATPase subunit alpha
MSIQQHCVAAIGDHPLTAEAIARQVHIIKGKTKVEVAAERGCDESDIQPDEYDAVVLHGETLLTMDEDQWAEVYITY